MNKMIVFKNDLCDMKFETTANERILIEQPLTEFIVTSLKSQKQLIYTLTFSAKSLAVIIRFDEKCWPIELVKPATKRARVPPKLCDEEASGDHETL